MSETIEDFVPHPLKVIIYEEATGYPLYQSEVFEGKDDVMGVYAADRIWYLALNLYNFANSVDLEVPKSEREVVKICFETTQSDDSSSSSTSTSSSRRADVGKFGRAHEPSLSGRDGIGMVCSQRTYQGATLRCFTLHDNSMCSEPLMRKMVEFNDYVIDDYLTMIKPHFTDFKRQLLGIGEQKEHPFRRTFKDINELYSKRLKSLVEDFNESLTSNRTTEK
ncbi:uncharacterized protein MONOS_5743 [Monocercomonoides exilis]|uniref:uncharacterized protein n=1 Tax=Monocercomonoides exilis TaxID=2049356 RepID=UPI0035593BB8|nr:hypothetical protein MONOS_5743 [Monocercomonoides exilis]|eukprot:MONOS_5743.1-p1 / transcript=MONOS_5743.1 / gene=MONOS_5743 / organism=Monocercomonoides_exilis_PA203 / gene_product=unspecified product / transcript_product=unspecified product / location=Mono_scaffold00171:98516-99360(-) / protein_length=222 / sequence_SO=supercontig / SO=protein_coding / is_pseudo=false